MIEKGIRRKYMIVIIRLISFLLLPKLYIIPFPHAHSQVESPQLQLLVVELKHISGSPESSPWVSVSRSCSCFVSSAAAAWGFAEAVLRLRKRLAGATAPQPARRVVVYAEPGWCLRRVEWGGREWRRWW